MSSPRRKKNDRTIDLQNNAQRYLITENDLSSHEGRRNERTGLFSISS
ncbi:hypothetical protein [Arenibacter palladensis]|nr:hypothetical protein [Arenibacter palladensis]